MKKPSIVKALKYAFSDTYANLGKLVVGNLILTASLVPTVLLALRLREDRSPILFLALIPCVLLVSPALAGLFTMSLKIVTKDHRVGLDDFIGGARKHWKMSIALTLISILVPVAAWNALTFYQQLLTRSYLAVGMWFGSLWVLILFLLAQIYFFPLMVAQRMTLRDTLKTALFLALGNGFFTVVILVVEVLVLVLSSFTGIVFLLGGSFVVVLQSNAFIQVAQRHTGKTMRKEVPKPEGRKRTLQDILRETIFPWRYQ